MRPLFSTDGKALPIPSVAVQQDGDANASRRCAKAGWHHQSHQHQRWRISDPLSSAKTRRIDASANTRAFDFSLRFVW